MSARRRATRPPATSVQPVERAEPVARELWVLAAHVVLALTALLFAYLGLRPGGRGPLWAWRFGRDACFFAALAVLAWGVARSALRRPFLRRSRTRAFLVLVLVLGVTPFQFPYPSSHEGRPSSALFRLPVDGEWRVFWGGEDKQSNRLAGFFAEQRWALALVREENGRRTREAPAENAAEPHPSREPADFLAFGEPVLAPAAGTIVWTRDGLPDGDLVTYAPGVAMLGNTIVLEVGPSEFLFLCHLQVGSIAIGAGVHVESGTNLARVGSSGLSRLVPEPHLLVFLQDSALEDAGEPIPWALDALLVDDQPVERSLPRGGIALDGHLIGNRVREAPPATETGR
jgi:hypothetical protein